MTVCMNSAMMEKIKAHANLHYTAVTHGFTNESQLRVGGGRDVPHINTRDGSLSRMLSLPKGEGAHVHIRKQARNLADTLGQNRSFAATARGLASPKDDGGKP